MRIEKIKYKDGKWNREKRNIFGHADIVFTFGDRDAMKDGEIYRKLKKMYPSSDIVGCSSGGNILGDSICECEMVATAISFERGSVRVAIKDFSHLDNQVEVSKKLISLLPKENLKHIFILSDGLNMNGSSLVKGANEAVKDKIGITGGLAGDGLKLKETVVRVNGIAKSKRVVAVGFYGQSIYIESGCYAGWNEFGILRKITKSVGNIVYEIDGKPALELYKKYLGEYANSLPKSALNFPISIRASHADRAIIRSVLGVDEEKNALIFAGDVPEGYLGRLMKTNVDCLIDGAETAAKQINQINHDTALGLVVSCIGRKLFLKQLVDEEVESIYNILGSSVELVGFHSYGEIASSSKDIISCNLHNQTMTLTVVYEV
jgi:hypothetical protein